MRHTNLSFITAGMCQVSTCQVPYLGTKALHHRVGLVASHWPQVGGTSYLKSVEGRSQLGEVTISYNWSTGHINTAATTSGP